MTITSQSISSTIVNDVPRIIFFSTTTIFSDDRVDKFNKLKVEIAHLGGEVGYCDTWTALSSVVSEFRVNILVVHEDTIGKTLTAVSNFINMITTMSNYMVLTNYVKIVVCIKPTTSQHYVKKLRAAGVSGIFLDTSFDGETTTIVDTMLAVLNFNAYWPTSIIDQLPVGNDKPISIYIRKDWRTYVTPVILGQLNLDSTPWQLQFCSNWDELGIMLNDKPHQIIFHIEMINNIDVTISEFVSMLSTLIKIIIPETTIPIGVGIEKDTPLSTVKALQKAGVHGIAPSAVGFGTDETYLGIEALFNRVPYWPKHILDQLPTTAKKASTKVDTHSIQITNRQRQILDLVCNRGLSNKKIASSLNIAESTVKIHVSAILKSYGVRNRTQLVLAARHKLTA